MQLISKYDKEFRFLLYVNDIFNIYVWVVSLENKKGITYTVFQKILDEFNHEPNKI